MGKNPQAITEELKEAMLDAIEKHGGNIKQAADAVKITTQTHYRWQQEDYIYGQKANSRRDICYRSARDKLISFAMKKIEEGNTTILNKMLSIYLKKLPEEMGTLSIHNNAKFRVGIRYVDPPADRMSLDRDEKM